MTGGLWFEIEQQDVFSDFSAACEKRIDRIVAEMARVVFGAPEIARLVEPSLRTRVPDTLRDQVQNAMAGRWQVFESTLAAAGMALGRAEVGLRSLPDIGAAFTASLVPVLVEEFGARPLRFADILALAQQLVLRSTAVVAEAYAEARKESTDQRHLGEQPLARLFESGIMGILICDLVGNIKEANDSFLETFGYTRAELVSGQVRWGEMTPPEFQHLDDDAVEQLKARGVTRPWEKEYFHKNGTRIPILVGVAMLGDAECIAFVLDISERRRLEELRARSTELETQNRRIQESNRLKSEFLANMSHELRTPLNSIIGFAELLHTGEISAESPQHEEFLGDILNSGRHLLQLINDVLDLAKVEAGKFEFRAQQVDLASLVSEVVAVVRSVAASKQIRIETDVDPAVGKVTLDPARLKQVLYNYVSNAIKFTGDGGGVRVRARPEGPDMFRLEVEDTGIGIDPADIGRLFVEFQQLDAGVAKKHSGTGLGLALTKRIVEAQGGSVGVRSTRGVGSAFFATLPTRVDSITTKQDDTIAAARDASTAILVVEDDARDRALLVQTLHKAGYGVEIAATGVQAIAASEARSFDAITLDLLLPDITGLDVLHKIRTAGRNRQTPVIVVTVVADKGMVGGFAVHDFLAKPINGAELVGSLQRAGVSPDQRASILVVDDDPAALKIMEAKLGSHGYSVVCCSGGEDALAAIPVVRPAAVILDLMMPGVDGFEFLAHFRRDPANRATPVIVWTLKDLTAEDHLRLEQFAQIVVRKQGGATSSLLDELRGLLSRRPNAET